MIASQRIKKVTLDNSNKLSKTRERVPKFIVRTPLINLDVYEVEADDDDDYDEDEDEDKKYVPSPKMVFKLYKPHQVVIIIIIIIIIILINKGKEEKGRRGRKKKETNIPPPPPVDSSGGDGGGTNLNVAQVQVAIEAAGGKGSLDATGKVVAMRLGDHKEVSKLSSYIKKYLAQKLSLQSKDGVELHMLGMPIRPDLPLNI
ncbi:hypothetical protein KY289_026567 [Solanum tuberosum]|nr:hypothetical protein KY289_026567 [Solanum tuberosum]